MSLHPNDVKNARKHRKMLRRGAPHPRALMSEETASYKPTGKLLRIGGDDSGAHARWVEILKGSRATRSIEWWYMAPRGGS